MIEGTMLELSTLDPAAPLDDLEPLALDNLDPFLVRADPAAGDLLDRARQSACEWAGADTMPAFAAYADLEPAARDASNPSRSSWDPRRRAASRRSWEPTGTARASRT
jgi:hypothetical protein